MSEGVDYSFDRPNISALWSAGKQFAGRYFGLGTQDKIASRTELNALQGMGLSVFNLAEQWGNSALDGYGKGTSHAIAVLDDLNAKGVPSNRPVYFAVDFDVTASQWPAVYAYFSGVNGILPLDRIGIYGGLRAMQWAARDGAAKWFFQTYAWSGGVWFDGNHVEQYSNNHIIGGGHVDYCRSVKEDFGQWGGSLIPPIAIDQTPAPVVTGASWDYVGDIDAHASDEGQLAGTLDGYARDLDGLRNL